MTSWELLGCLRRHFKTNKTKNNKSCVTRSRGQRHVCLSWHCVKPSSSRPINRSCSCNYRPHFSLRYFNRLQELGQLTSCELMRSPGFPNTCDCSTVITAQLNCEVILFNPTQSAIFSFRCVTAPLQVSVCHANLRKNLLKIFQLYAGGCITIKRDKQYGKQR